MPATTAVPTAIPPPPAATAPPPSAASEAFVRAAPDSVLIAVPVLAAPKSPADPAAAAIAGAATKAAPPVATVAATTATVFPGFSEIASTTSATSPPATPGGPKKNSSKALNRPIFALHGCGSRQEHSINMPPQKDHASGIFIFPNASSSRKSKLSSNSRHCLYCARSVIIV